MPDFDKLPPKNIVNTFWEKVKKYGSRTALLSRIGEKYNVMTWESLAQKVNGCALGLHQLKVQRGDRIALLSENRPEWVITDLAILSLGAVVVPIYPTASLEDVKHILENSGAEILFLSTLAQFERISPIFPMINCLRGVVLFDEHLPSTEKNFIKNMNELFETGRLGSLNNDGLYERMILQIHPEDLATIIYTSGTTGPAKGVMLTHRNFLENCQGAQELIKISECDLALSFLPLSHVFERLAGYYFMLFNGAKIAYAQSMQTVVEDMGITHPTVAAAVPRFYEKVYAKIIEGVKSGPPFREKIFFWALSVGRKISDQKYLKIKADVGPLQIFLAEKLVLQKIRRVLGGKIRFFISGGAPLNKEIADFFYSLGILILEGYGLTETSPVITVNSESAFKFGTVGKPLSPCKVTIAEDGEILTKGPCVMSGYYRNPQATAEAIIDGWFYTGDIGEFDSEGYLKITDRKKDIIKTSGGKMISPQNIEKLILADSFYSQVVILGDKRNYIVALIVPNKARVLTLAKQESLEDLSYESLLKHPQIMSFFEGDLRHKIASLASFEQIKYFTLLPNEFTQDSGELTPTLKVKRRVIQERYKDRIESMYATSSFSQAAFPSP